MGGTSSPPSALGLGCMRLSTSPARDEERALAVIHAALDGGVRWLDTAHAYSLGEDDMGHNERLLARALAAWPGPRDEVRVATKGGMARPGGRWVPDGRAGSLLAGCEASARALGVDALDVFLLHAPDPRTPLATSVRALARVREEGLARVVGLCNVRLHQLRAALELAPVEVVQVALSPWDDDPLRDGTLDLCRERGLILLAHSPLGGPARAPRLAQDETLARLAGKHGASPQEVALAWLLGLHPAVVPLPGATRVETAKGAAGALRIRLDEADRSVLRARFQPAASAPGDAAPTPGSPAPSAGEVVLLVGMPAAGKTSLARAWEARGFRRLNRDERGGRLRDLLPEMAALADETSGSGPPVRLVLDNTYGSRAERQRVLETARGLGLSTRCVWLDTPLPEAQINAVLRLLERHGRLLEPDELREASRADPNLLGPGALFRFRRGFEPPGPDEGFGAFERRPFLRRWEGERPGRGLVVEYDGVLRRSRSGARAPLSPEDVEAVEGAAEALVRWRDAGYRLLGLAWYPEVAHGSLSPGQVERTLARTHELLGVELEAAVCTHAAGPPVCWCRKPLPGLVVAFLERHHLHPRSCVLAGPGPADRTLAERTGLGFLPTEGFLEGPPGEAR